MKNTAEAQDVLAAALLREDLEDDWSLVDALIDSYTSHKGFSNDETTFKSWLSKVSAEPRIRLIKGEWRRRIDTHLAQWQKDTPSSYTRTTSPPAQSLESPPLASSSAPPLSDADMLKAALAVRQNMDGMDALVANDRQRAIHAFTDAIEILIDLWSRNPDDDQIANDLANIYSNRADAWLMGGLVSDAPIALLDATKAEVLDPSCSKACVIQSTCCWLTK
jgi:hypothetical protein